VQHEVSGENGLSKVKMSVANQVLIQKIILNFNKKKWRCFIRNKMQRSIEEKITIVLKGLKN